MLKIKISQILKNQIRFKYSNQIIDSHLAPIFHRQRLILRVLKVIIIHYLLSLLFERHRHGVTFSILNKRPPF